jgi:pimeloyl-ACP methyl ester carboxylesterase
MTPIATMIRKGPPMPQAQSDQMIAAMVTAPVDRDRVSGWSKASAPGVVANAAADDLTLDLRPDLASIKTPITLLYPDNIPNGMPAGAAEGFYTAAFANLPNKTLVRIDQSRHFIMFDQPAAFDKALDAFLGS